MFSIKKRYSKAIRTILVNPINRTCRVTYNGGAVYLFKNVRRSKLMKLVFIDEISFGFWNKYLRQFAQPETRYNVPTGQLTYKLVGSIRGAV